MAGITQSNLDFWIKFDLNVLMTAPHGVGKSSIIQQAFDKAGLNWKYFSAATMDPWVDFIGVPYEEVDKEGNKSLGLLRPPGFADDTVEAIFIDEINRAASPKIQNACMELIQFRSINGHKFNNLKMVWAARNPEDADGTYHVQKMDPAQVDRFHIHIDINDAPELKYFQGKYGDAIAHIMTKWWRSNPADVKRLISPRRLDYAADIFLIGGDLRDVLPKQSSVAKLTKDLDALGKSNKFDAFVKARDLEGAKKFVSKNFDNIFDNMEGLKNRSSSDLGFISRVLPDESVLGVLAKTGGVIGSKLKKACSEEPEVKARFELLKESTEGSVPLVIYDILGEKRPSSGGTPAPVSSLSTPKASEIRGLCDQVNKAAQTTQRLAIWDAFKTKVALDDIASLDDSAFHATCELFVELKARSQLGTLVNKYVMFSEYIEKITERTSSTQTMGVYDKYASGISGVKKALDKSK